MSQIFHPMSLPRTSSYHTVWGETDISGHGTPETELPLSSLLSSGCAGLFAFRRSTKPYFDVVLESGSWLVSWQPCAPVGGVVFPGALWRRACLFDKRILPLQSPAAQWWNIFPLLSPHPTARQNPTRDRYHL